MKLNSKLSLRIISASASIALLATAAPAFAITPERANTTTTTGEKVATKTPTQNFCTQLSTLSAKLTTKQGDTETKLRQRKATTTQEQTDRKNKRAQQLAEMRAKADAERASMYEQLLVKATTSAQKQAVADFKVAIEAAVTARRTAVDAAIKAYWDGVASIMNARKEAVTNAGADLKTTVKKALDTAKSECDAGTAPATVRQNFANTLKAAKTELTNDRKAIDKAGTQIKALAETRNAAIKKAIDDFKKMAEKARATFKAAFEIKAKTNAGTKTTKTEPDQ
jgi:hypothetical protein